jgi:hypothetical protein
LGLQIFTSMDVKAITTDRVRVLDPLEESALFNRLAALGTATYASLNIGSLIRLDIRADSNGELYVLVGVKAQPCSCGDCSLRLVTLPALLPAYTCLTQPRICQDMFLQVTTCLANAMAACLKPFTCSGAGNQKRKQHRQQYMSPTGCPALCLVHPLTGSATESDPVQRPPVSTPAPTFVSLQEANPKPDLKRPSDSGTSLVCEGLGYLGLSYEDLISCLLVERLWQLQQHRPCMLAHFMPPTLCVEDMVSRLPGNIHRMLQLSEQSAQVADWEVCVDSSEASDDGMLMMPVRGKELSAVVVERRASSWCLEKSCGVLVGPSALRELRAWAKQRRASLDDESACGAGVGALPAEPPCA